MISAPPTLLVVTGLQREARIAGGHGVLTLCSGGDPALLQERLSALFRDPARPHPEDPLPIPPPLAGEGGEGVSRRMGPPSSFETGATRPPQDEGGRFIGILSFGLAGGLAEHLRSGDLVISSGVVSAGNHHHAHEGWHDAVASTLGARLPVHRGRIAGRDLVLAKSSEKISVHMETGALAVDMESHIAADYAQRHNLPFAAIRAISDPVTRNLPPVATDALMPDGKIAFGRVIRSLLRDTDQLPAMIAAGIDSERAFASLRRCRRLLGPLFGLCRADL